MVWSLSLQANDARNIWKSRIHMLPWSFVQFVVLTNKSTLCGDPFHLKYLQKILKRCSIQFLGSFQAVCYPADDPRIGSWQSHKKGRPGGFSGWISRRNSLLGIQSKSERESRVLPEWLIFEALLWFMSLALFMAHTHMGGLALMVISPKNWEFLPFLMPTLWIIQPHLMSFNDFIWTFR